MIEVRDWLPVDTPVPSALDRAIDACASGWMETWFRGGRPTLRALGRMTAKGFAWRTLDTGVMIGIADGGALAIGRAALDLPPGDRPEADRAVVEAVAEECLVDLRQRLAVFAGGQRDAAWTPTIVPPTRLATIAAGRVDAVAIGLSDEAFTRMAKDALAPAAETPLGDGATALAACPIVVGAQLTGATLTLAELETLGIGDVIVLGHGLDDPTRLTADGAPLATALCMVDATSSAPCLEIIDPLHPASMT